MYVCVCVRAHACMLQETEQRHEAASTSVYGYRWVCGWMGGYVCVSVRVSLCVCVRACMYGSVYVCVCVRMSKHQ